MRVGLRARALLGAATLAALTASSAVASRLAAQDVQVADVRLSADTLRLGDLFDLTFTLTLPNDRVVFMPDSLDSSGFAPFGPVQWSRIPRAGDVVQIAVRYPLIAFQVGTVEVPDFALFTAPGGESVAAGLSSPGDAVGSWAPFREAPGSLASARPVAIPERRLWVASVLAVPEGEGSLVPRPAADVVGSSRNWLAAGLVAVFALVLAGALVRIAHRVFTHVRHQAVAADRRARALRALDELLAEGGHRDGRVSAFYARSSEIVRRYVESFDRRWSPAWTSTELMTDLDARLGEQMAAPLSGEMTSAEHVKFGGRRPDPERAEAHLKGVREWVATREPREP